MDECQSEQMKEETERDVSESHAKRSWHLKAIHALGKVRCARADLEPAGG